MSAENDKRNEFDWLVSYACFRSLLRDWLEANGFSLDGKLSALVLGCGSSGLSQALVDDGICDDVLSIDLSQGCIDFLSEKNKDDARLRWAVADLNDPHQMAVAANGQRFDLIVDKATLDAVVCDVDCAGYLHAVASLMRCGGAYILVSLYHRALLQPLLDPSQSVDLAQAVGRSFLFACKHFDGSESGSAAHEKDQPQNESLGLHQVERAFVTLLDTRGRQQNCSGSCKCDFSIEITQIRAHFAKTLEWYLTKVAPMLSNDREIALRSAFAAHGSNKVPLEEAYHLMFTAEEREVYSFSDFCSDGAVTAGAFDAESALEFIRTNQ